MKMLMDGGMDTRLIATSPEPFGWGIIMVIILLILFD